MRRRAVPAPPLYVIVASLTANAIVVVVRSIVAVVSSGSGMVVWLGGDLRTVCRHLRNNI